MLVILLLAAPCGVTGVRAQGPRESAAEASSEDPQAAIRFRRVYAPAAQPEAWPRQATPYFPVQPEEFERLLSLGKTAARQGETGVAGALASALYKARLVEDDLRDGEASLEVVHASATRAMISLDGCNLAISRPVWSGKDEQPAELGLTADGKLALLVEKPGRLCWNWSLHGRRDAQGVLDLLLELPACPRSRLILDLPPKCAPLVDCGLAIREPDNEVNRWRLEVGGHRRVHLRVASDGQLVKRRSWVQARQTLVYELSPQGLELSAQLSLDVYQEPLRQAVLQLDPGLQLVSARYGAAQLPWSPLASAGEGKTSGVVLEFPEAIQGVGRVVRLKLLAPLQLGSRWRLPSVRPDGVFWQEGSATLLVAAPLVVEQLTPLRSRQVRVAPLRAPWPGESMELQYFAPDAGVELLVNRPQAPLRLDCGTAVELSGGGTTARTVADFSVAEGEIFQLEGELARQWIVDTVQSTPSDALGDWNIEKGETGVPRLTIQLAKALSPSRPVRLQIIGRRLHSPVGRWLGVNDLVPLRFRTAAAGRRLVNLRAVEPYRLKSTGAEQLSLVEPQGLEPAALRLLATPVGSLLFEEDAAAADLRVSLEPQNPSYAATIRVEATTIDGTLVESYRMNCIPAGARVERVLVKFSRLRTTPLQWTLGGGEESGLTARRLDEDLAAGPAGSSAETWEITLQHPQNLPFEIRARRTGKLTKKEPLSLASLPEATSQRATLVVSASGASAIRVEGAQLEPIPNEATPADQSTTARASYRYRPGHNGVPLPEATLAVWSPGSVARLPAAWIWDCRLESRYDPAGTARHVARFYLQNAGRRQFQLTLPPEAQLASIRGVWVDEARAAWRIVGPKTERRLAIDLPAARRFPLVSLQFATLDRPLRFLDQLQPALPEADVPVLARQWTAWLPPGYEALEPEPRRQAHAAPGSTWAQRLFGPLGRSDQRPPFDPLDLGSWSAVTGDSAMRLEALRKARLLVQVLGDQGARQAKEDQAGRGDWASLLASSAVDAALADPSGHEKMTLLIDRAALSALDITPQTPVAVPANGSNAGRGAAMLQQASVALLVYPRAIVLTSCLRAALDQSQLLSVDQGVLWWIQPGTLADSVESAVEGKSVDALLPVAQWQQRPMEPQGPWTPACGDGFQPGDTLGWKAYRIQLTEQVPLPLAIAHRATLCALRWGVFLLVVGLTWWWGSDRPGPLLGLAGVFGAGALLLPAGGAVPASGALLGTIFTLLARLIRRQEESDDATRSQERSRTHLERPGGATAMALIGLSVWLLSSQVMGEEPAPKAAPPAEAAAVDSPPAKPENSPVQPPEPKAGKPTTPSTVFDVFIPTNEKDQSNGEPYQVPEGLYKELYRRAAAMTEVPQGWLLTAAAYRGVLAWQGTPERLMPAELEVTFDLEVFSPETHVRVPLNRDGLSLVPDGATLDGRVIQPDWQDEGTRLAFDVAEAGRYQLRLLLRPTPRIRENDIGFDLRVPRLANSQLELTVPPNAPTIEVPSALGAVVQETDPARLVAELGPSESLAVRWQDSAGVSSAGPAVDAEQLLWLKVQPDSVVLDAHFKFRVLEGQLQEVELAADPRLRLLPLPEGSPSVSVSPGGPGEPQALRVAFARPVMDQVELALSFLLTETAGIGNLRLPRLEVQGVRLPRAWLGVWVDPGLQYQQQTELEAVPVPAFSAAWGPSPVQPLLACNLADRSSAWALSVWPSESRIQAQQTLALGFDQHEARVQFDAQLVTSGGYCFQYRVLAPPALVVEKVSLQAEQGERVARWSRRPDGAVVVFLNAPVTGVQQLALRGRLPVNCPGTEPLPTLEVEGAEVQTRTLNLFRKPAVLVRLDKAAGLTDVGTPIVDENAVSLGRLVKSFQGKAAEPLKAAVVLSLNRPKVRAVQRTSVRLDGDVREAKVDFQLQVERGQVDQWRIQVPPEWSGPYQIDPPSSVKLVDVPGEKNRRLVIRPRTAVSGDCHLTIAGPLTLAAGASVGAPQIDLEEAELEKHLLILPTQWQLHPVVWETQGLQPVPLPEDFDAQPLGRESFVAYQTQQPSFEAVLKPLVGIAQVFLADVSLAWTTEGGCHGVAQFDLQSAGLSHCWLRLPAGHRLVQVTVAGVPTTPLRGKEGRWQIALSPSGLPQRVEVLFTGRLAAPGRAGRCTLEAPMLDELPVRQTLWTVSGPADYEFRSLEGVKGIGRLEQELVRLRSLNALFEQAADTTTAEPEQTVLWQRTWARHWLVAVEQSRRQATLSAGDASSASTERQALIRELEMLTSAESPAASQLGVVRPSAAEPQLADSPNRLWLVSLGQASPVFRGLSAQGASTLTLACQPLEAGQFLPRLRAALLCGLLAAILVWATRRGLLAAAFARWPQAVGVLFGLAWWLWLEPSMLGWAIVLASLIAAVRPSWRAPTSSISAVVTLHSHPR
jgi:hypothetical protein